MSETITAFPLTWPMHKPRTQSYKIERSSFTKKPFGKVRDEMVRELERLGARDPIISTNIPLRQDGMPYANFRQPSDFGVAVYFKHKGKSMSFACDRWDRIEDNMHAIIKTIDALRGVARWGTGDMMEAAFTGFLALPPPIALGSKKHWREVLEFGNGEPTREQIRKHHQLLSQGKHPDQGGSHDEMAALNVARDEALKECMS